VSVEPGSIDGEADCEEDRLGDVEGLVDGDTEEDSDVEGLVDGDTEEDSDVEGLVDGDVDGLSEGDLDGDVDGDLDGLSDGDVDGDVDGLSEGDLDGDVDGLSEGELDGETLDDADAGSLLNAAIAPATTSEAANEIAPFCAAAAVWTIYWLYRRVPLVNAVIPPAAPSTLKAVVPTWEAITRQRSWLGVILPKSKSYGLDCEDDPAPLVLSSGVPDRSAPYHSDAWH
jgi:hypothetical protein